MALPVTLDDGFVRLIDKCFQPDEFVAISPAAENEEGEIVPRRGVTLTATEWKSKVAAKGGIDRVFGTKLGLFLRINPMAKGGAKNEDVTAFRHVLVEFDRDETGKPIPKEEQYHAVVASGMPVAALIDSGNKSLHAWVRVDAPDEKEYKRRVEIIWGWFSGAQIRIIPKNPGFQQGDPAMGPALVGDGSGAAAAHQGRWDGLGDATLDQHLGPRHGWHLAHQQFGNRLTLRQQGLARRRHQIRLGDPAAHLLGAIEATTTTQRQQLICSQS